jgi:hypothetical protein
MEVTRMPVKMHVNDQDLDHIAQEMSGRFDEAAAWIAREMAEIADRMFDRNSAEWWQYIASAIEQRQSATVITIPLHRRQAATAPARSKPPVRGHQEAEKLQPARNVVRLSSWSTAT